MCVGSEEVSGGTQCHLKRSAWRHGISNITPWCQAHFYKHSLNDTQLAAWRQLSLPSLRPNLSLPPSLCTSFRLFSSSLTLWCSAGLPPILLPPFAVQTSWSRSCTNSLPGAGAHFLFFLWDFLCSLCDQAGQSSLSGRDFLMHRQLGR